MGREWVPFSGQRWSQIIPGLWVGGAQAQASVGEPGTIGEVHVSDEFIKVYSMLYLPPRFGPTESWRHHVFPMEDEALMPDLHAGLDGMAARVAEDIQWGRKVLVRCWAGYNRSALLAALAMVKLGIEPQATIDLLRTNRSPHALSNGSFRAHILRQEVHNPGTDRIVMS